MELFEIIFILLLMLPMALLMRYFVTRLSREKPKQRRYAAGSGKQFPGKFQKKRREHKKSDRIGQTTAREQEKQQAVRYPAGNQSPPMPSLQKHEIRQEGEYQRDSGFAARTHTALKRTEKISFTELYAGAARGNTGIREQGARADASGTQTRSVSDTRRSQQEPTRRQKRARRIHSRKRAKRRESKRNTKENRT